MAVGVAAVVAAVVAVLESSVAGASPARPHAFGQSETVAYAPPVDAPVVDPFRPPGGPYGAGNRGLEYDTPPGSAVRASAAGTVTFAGPVAGALHVTVLHGDGVRTSYSFLRTVEVVTGQRLRQGDRLGTSGERLHFGARIGDAYIDPATLFTGAVARVELLPFEVSPGATPDAEVQALLSLTTGSGGFSPPGAGEVVEWLRDRARASVSDAPRLNPLSRGVDLARDLAHRLLLPGPCSRAPAPDRPVAGQRRVAVTVAGLGSSSSAASIDDLRVDDFGYRRDRVVRFSYAGGRTPSTGGAFDGIDARAYEPADTQGDVEVAAARLADLVEQVAQADPDAAIDLVGHSLGGLVARLALAELERRGFGLDRLGVVVTLGSPHQGAHAASALVAASSRPVSHLALDAAAGLLGTGLDPDAPVIDQLAEGSEMVAGLAADGVPGDVRLVSIAARGDVVVAAPRARVAGAVNVIVPVTGLGAHADLVGSDAATAEVARALAGNPPGCESWDDVVADLLTGHAISLVEDQIVAGAAVGW